MNIPSVGWGGGMDVIWNHTQPLLGSKYNTVSGEKHCMMTLITAAYM